MDNKEGLEKNIKQLAFYLEKMKIAEYVELLNNPRKLLWVNFIAGIARGLGTAIGLTIVFSVLIYFLQRLVLLNLPLISDLIAKIIKMVNESSSLSNY